MKIVLLGTNGYGPSEDGHTACFMIPELGIMLDAGSGLFRVADYLQTPTLDIYLSHAHLDHTFGLTHLWGAFMKYQVQQMGSDPLPAFQTISDRINQMMGQVHIHATVEVLQGVEERLGLWSDLQYVTLNDTQTLPGDGTLKVFPVEHGVPCYGFRLEWPGHSLAYVTDTIVRADSPYIEHLKGVDLLLHDAYMPDQWADVAHLTSHSNTSGAAQVAAQAGAGRLILIHHNTAGLRADGAELAAARAIFPATEVGLDKMEIEF